MKWINYKFVSATINAGTEEEPIMQDVLSDKSLSYSEENLEIVKREAYNGEYTIEDDGQPEPVAEPTADEVLNAMLGVM